MKKYLTLESDITVMALDIDMISEVYEWMEPAGYQYSMDEVTARMVDGKIQPLYAFNITYSDGHKQTLKYVDMDEAYHDKNDLINKLNLD